MYFRTAHGKTCAGVYAQLCHDHVPVSTVPSLKESVGNLGATFAEFSVVDTPGADRLRTSFVAQFGLRTKALIFMIDSKEFSTEVRTTAN